MEAKKRVYCLYRVSTIGQVGVHRYGGNVGKEQRKNTDKRQQSYLCFFI